MPRTYKNTGVPGACTSCAALRIKCSMTSFENMGRRVKVEPEEDSDEPESPRTPRRRRVSRAGPSNTAAPDVEELGTRVASVESKLDAILKLLQEKKE